MCGVLPPLHLRALHLHFYPSGMDPLQHEPKGAPKRQKRSRTETERLNINEETENSWLHQD